MRYLRLWMSFLRASVLADTEYRFNIVMRVLSECVWYVSQLSVFEVLYTHTTAIAGWDVHAMRVFMGSLFLVDNVYMLLFMENVDYIGSLVRKGDLDQYLTKPVNSQFMISCRKVATSYLPNLALVVGYLVWAVRGLPHAPNATALVAFGFLFLCGVMIYYAVRFMIGTLVIILQDASNIQFIWHQIFRLATRPDPVYPRALRLLILSVLPVAFFASVPARALTEGLNLRLLLAAPLLATSLLWLSHIAWTAALKRYASASS